ncbi:MAG: hypothetical protein ACP5PS_00380, partial [Bacteroidales bacterium]
APVLALISGAGGIASLFSWLEPARPYLIVTTLLVLGFAWYQKLKPRTDEEIQCACEEDEKPPFMQTKVFRNGNHICIFDDGFSLLRTHFLSESRHRGCIRFF